jgi:hypothetical protein
LTGGKKPAHLHVAPEKLWQRGGARFDLQVKASGQLSQEDERLAVEFW